MHTLIAQHLPGIEAICKRYRRVRLAVFGSSARAGDEFFRQSDADFLVEFAADARPGLNEFFGAKSEFEGLLGRSVDLVDLVEPAAVRKPCVLSSVNGSRELVHAA